MQNSQSRIFTIDPIHYGSPEYHDAVRLRSEILREPLGLSFSESDLAAEEKQLHFGAYENGALVGTMILSPLSAEIVQMRQVAVSPKVQGSGIGKLLVERSEAEARERGFRIMQLKARETAVEFYLRLGYRVEGEPLVEVTLPHRRMTKSIAEPAVTP